MSKSIARRFIEEIFNEVKIDEAEKFVTPDIICHGVFDQIRGLQDFKRCITEDHKAFSDTHTIEDDFEEQNKVAIRWTFKLRHGKEFSDIPGVDIFHFEKDKIKEAWTIFDALTPAAQLGIVEKRTEKEPAGTRRFRL